MHFGRSDGFAGGDDTLRCRRIRPGAEEETGGLIRRPLVTVQVEFKQIAA